MKTKNQIPHISIIITALLVLGVLCSSIGTGTLPSARAQEGEVESQAQHVQSTETLIPETDLSPDKLLANAIPSGFNQILNDTGVVLYKKDYSGGQPDYVQVVSLNQGASVVLMHGSIASPGTGQGSYGGNNPSFYRSSLQNAWNSFSASKSGAFCITNGQFFADRRSDGTLIDPTNLAFPLKKDGTVLSDGYGSTTEFQGQLLMLELWSDHANIQSLSKDVLYNSSAPNILGGLSEGADKGINTYTGRTFAGVDDANGDGTYETVLFFNSSTSRQVDAAQVLRNFGAEKVIMFDGGGSTQLHCRGNNYVSSSRTIPQTIGVVKGGVFCNPNADQVAFYADANYSGACVVKGIGNYPDPGSMGITNDTLSSIKVGGNVKLTLCRDNNYAGICEPFIGDDSNLSDNSIGNDQASSAKVESRPPSCTNGAASGAIRSGYTYCAEEGGVCSFGGQASVAYGANSCFTYKNFTNSASCDNNSFLDPIIGTHKACYFRKLGDANADGMIDGRDYVIWVNHYGRITSQGPADGDFNNDGTVSGVDYIIWVNNYGR